jgi:methylglutaconyl-CoA hydratase
MNYSSVKHTTEGRLSVVTLNRPEVRNALNDVMIRELTDVFSTINRNNHSRAIVLTGAGASFCAGMDLEYLQKFSQMGEHENLEDARNLMRLLQAIHSSKKPVIAMVNGPALGGGCGIASACDFVFAAREKGKIGAPEVRLGFLPALILVYLIKRMGFGKAREFTLQGEILSAENAKDKGLVTEVIDDAVLQSSVFEFTNKLISSTSSTSVSLTKELFSRFDEMAFKDAMEYAANLNALTRKTDDFKRGVQSFLDKGKLEW